MRLTRPLLAVVVTFLVAGAVLLLVGERADDYGWFAYAPLKDDAPPFDRFGVTPWQTTAGWVLLWLSSVVAAGLAGAALVRRRVGRD